MTNLKVIVEHENVSPGTVELVNKAIEEKQPFALCCKSTYVVYDLVNLCRYHEGCTRIKFLINDIDSFVAKVTSTLIVFNDFSYVELKRNPNGYERYMLKNNNNS